MKPWIAIGLCLLLAAGLTGCREKAAPAETQPELLLVDSKPTTQPTEETEPAGSTLPEFIENTAPTSTETTAAPTQPAPGITKEPTGETISQGGEAWFVARGENAQGIRWWFLPPDGSRELSPQDLSRQFPDLTLQGAREETLILGNVPLELSGWCVQAEFYAEEASTRTGKAPLTVKPPVTSDQLPLAYTTVIENCRFLLGFDPFRDSMDLLGEKDLYQLYEGFDMLAGGLCYAVLDVDGDGIPELLIVSRQDSTLFALFTQRNGSPVKILQSRARNRHYYCGSSTIYQEGSSGAADSAVCIYRLDGTGLTLQQALWSSSLYEEGAITYFYTQDSTMHEDSGTQITWDQYRSLGTELEARKQPQALSLTPIE